MSSVSGVVGLHKEETAMITKATRTDDCRTANTRAPEDRGNIDTEGMFTVRSNADEKVPVKARVPLERMSQDG
eukprot:CAMPEP_0194488370 /NCGR_PEP_ID=MMETSP0253-20130528/8316_1 /TAXON_ID=2966 /ORGANISM="Noctiluca scintillans" /LENGTH=72 /DNA_ID=CAMNT_0039328721 /DNA_START=349 /DNA_END=564 /DNA_ORIENTATION=+